MNSFRSLERAVAYEIIRQVDEIEGGGNVIQETRHWDEEAGVTHGCGPRRARRTTGTSPSRTWSRSSSTPPGRRRSGPTLPELPAQRRARYVELGVDTHKADVLSAADPGIRAMFDDAVAAGADPRSAAIWITGEVIAWLRREDGRSTRLD